MKKENKNLVLIGDVNVWDKNPREISSKDFESLKKKIERWGIWKPFLVWESKKQILGGNSRFKACKELGHKEIWVEYREPKDDAEALEMAIADNESSGEWIKSLLIEQIKLSEDKINLEDYKIVIKDSSLKDFMPIDAEEDSPPDEADVQSVSVLGDLYELGSHRVLCGDSTSVDNVERLMDGKKADMVFTDPPYGVDYISRVDEERRKPWGEIKNDNLKGVELRQFLKDSLELTPEPKYICCNWQSVLDFLITFGKPNAFIIWDKGSIGLGKGYRSQYEIVLFYGTLNSSTESNVWSIKRDSAISYSHPTQKPIAISFRAIRNSSREGNIIYDAFLGSGSTLIACEKTERICYGMELDTHYTDVIVARYIKFMQDNGKSFTIKRNGEEIDYNLFLKDGK